MLAVDGIQRSNDTVPDANTESAVAGSIASQDAAKGIVTPATEQRALEGFRLAATGGKPVTALDQARANAIAADAQQAMNRSDLPEGVRAQVAKSLVRLGNGIMDGTVEPSINGTFAEHLHTLATQPYDPSPNLKAEATVNFKGALAQTTRAAQVLEQAQLAPGTKLTYDAGAGQTGVQRAGLPVLETGNIDADIYYKTGGTLLNPRETLHIDNVKFNPNTLGNQLKTDRTAGALSQTGRQGEWASQGTANEPRQLGFYMLDKGTAFSSFMDTRNLNQLANAIPAADHGTRNIIIGDRKYSINDLNALNGDATKAADAHVNALRQASSDPNTFDTGAAYRNFYKGIAGTPDEAMRSLGKIYGEKYPTSTPSVGQGAAWGAAAGATVSVIRLAADGRLDLHSAGQVATATAQGAAVGAVTTKLEQTITPVIDRQIGTTVEQKAAQFAVTRGLSQGGAEATGLAVRTLASRMAGSTVAGAVVSTAISAWENRDGLAHGDSKAIGNVASDTIVGGTSVLAATAAGAAIGSVVPIAGTAVGAVAGFAVGAAVAYGAQISGARDAIAHGISNAVDWVKGWF